jgi:hypothetical protein
MSQQAKRDLDSLNDGTGEIEDAQMFAWFTP